MIPGSPIETATRPVEIVSDPEETVEKFLCGLPGAEGIIFCLCAGSTKTSDIDGISAAGSTPESRRLTPTLDAEALILGIPKTCTDLPVSPEGIISPIVITRGCIEELKVAKKVFNCGMHVAPQIECETIGTAAAECVSTGGAITLDSVRRLVRAGIEHGEKLSEERDLVVVSECVPGGTTTAMAVLTALGFDAGKSVSSSLQQANHEFRGKLVQQGLQRAMLDRSGPTRSALHVMAAVGDPMQPFAAGLAIGASRRSKVLLAGGSQMIAVYALLRAVSAASELISEPEGADTKCENLATGNTEFGAAHATSSTDRAQSGDTAYSETLQEQGAAETSSSCGWTICRQKGELRNILVATTKWVVNDASARVAQLARLVGVPFVHSTVGLGTSRHEGLRAYELGHVKEGVGAGAALILASLIGLRSQDEIVQLIDSEYDRLVG